MIKIENVEIAGFESAIRGMRNPKNSWHLSDSEQKSYRFNLGDKDADLCVRLNKGGPVHAKYRRMITVWADITSNHTWWAEFDTYKVGTVRNSCSKMHKIHVKEFVAEDFSHEGIDEVGGIAKASFETTLTTLEWLRTKFNCYNEKRYWRAMIELLPMGFNLKATVMLNYETLANMYMWRHNHKMSEWVDFCKWIETLPYAQEIILAKERKHE